jgi:hypothetical protein
VIRLVSQFDDAETRASAATPTCGGCCCCCCCCIATAVSSSAYTAMNLRAHARELKRETGRSRSPWPEIIGGLALPIAILLVIGLAQIGLGAGALFIPAVAWFLILLGLYLWVGTEDAWLPALGTVLLSGVAAVIEFVVGAGLVASGHSGVVAYLILAGVVALGATILVYKLLLGDHDREPVDGESGRR